jgi:plasmid stabilization system protein ParE
VKVVYAQEAIRDLVGAYEYLIGRDDLLAAQHIDAKISRLVERLALREFEGPLTTLKSGARVRSWPAPPFRVVYTRDDLLRSRRPRGGRTCAALRGIARAIDLRGGLLEITYVSLAFVARRI